MGKTSIEWTDYSWNIWRGCVKVGPGCTNCYVERIMRRRSEDFGQLYLSLNHLEDPLHWARPGRIFVEDMGDLFDSRVPDDTIDLVFEVIRKAYWHTYQLLTKRPNRMRRFLLARPWWPLPHVWIGTSVEDRLHWARAELLKRIPVHFGTGVRFVSNEPLLAPMGALDLSGIHQMIVGGESGPGHRPFELDWARRIRDQCLEQGVAFFYKQGSGFRSGMDRELDGRLWEEFPAHIQEGSHV